jgi:glycosyltransferase involved in cell wall biosynthesis
MSTISVIIPALNEAGNIGSLVSEVHSTIEASVVVVDNGSSDGTAQEALSAGAHVVYEPRQGFGYACAAGVAQTLQAEILVFLDGDYSFLPAEMPALVAPILADEADMVLGSRWLGQISPGAMLPHQRFGNWLVSRSMKYLYGLPLTDLGPYRAVRRDLVESLAMREMTYGWPTEMIVKAANRGARIREVPVSYLNRRSGMSKVSGTLRGSLLAAWFILGVTLRYAIFRR